MWIRLLLRHWGTKITWFDVWSLWHLGWFWPFLCLTPWNSILEAVQRKKRPKYKQTIWQIVKKTRNMLLIQQWHKLSLRICDIFVLGPVFLLRNVNTKLWLPRCWKMRRTKTCCSRTSARRSWWTSATAAFPQRSKSSPHLTWPPCAGGRRSFRLRVKKLKHCAKLDIQAVVAHGSTSPSRMEVYLRHNKLSHPAKVLSS